MALCDPQRQPGFRGPIGKKLMPVDFLQKQEAGRAGPVTDGWSLGVPLGRGKLQPRAESAADSLQIAQKVICDAIVDCR
jgi:hypothetical protein